MKLRVTLVCCLVFLLLSSIGVCIERPQQLGNLLKLNTGEYLYAEDDPSLDFRLRNNFAVEFWFKLESVPEIPFQQRVLLAKPGSYAFVVLAEAGIFPKEGFLQPWIFPVLYFATTTEEGGGYHSSVFGGISPGEWHHFSFQTWLEGGIRHSAAYYNGGIPNEQNLPVKMWCVDTDSRFYIGGLPQEAIEGLAEAGASICPVCFLANLLG